RPAALLHRAERRGNRGRRRRVRPHRLPGLASRPRLAGAAPGGREAAGRCRGGAMTPERRERVWALFDGAVELPPGEREAFLDAACGDDASLRAEVESLLAHDSGVSEGEDEETFLKSPLLLSPEGPGLAPLSRRIGHYRILRELGSGGMGTVYEAEQDN